jgi:hypothetical protein
VLLRPAYLGVTNAFAPSLSLHREGYRRVTPQGLALPGMPELDDHPWLLARSTRAAQPNVWVLGMGEKAVVVLGMSGDVIRKLVGSACV